MSTPNGSLSPNRAEVFLSRTYTRIRWMTLALGSAGTIAGALFFGWRSGAGLIMGAAVAYVNFIWLHRGSALMIERLLALAGRAPSRLRLTLAFSVRYMFVLAIAYGIMKGLPSMIPGFTIGLFLPILAAMCEGVYEVLAGSRTRKKSN